jgi:hypothetical protein
MGKICALIFTLLGVSLSAFGQADFQLLAIEPRVAAGGGGSPTYLVKQGFEGTGYDNSETWNTEDGSPDPDYTGVVLDGSQSLRVNTSAGVGYTATTFADQDELWVYCKVRVVGSLPDGTMSLFSVMQAFSGVGGVQLLDNGKLRASHGGPIADTIDALSVDTTYHVWFHYTKGTGADGVASVGFSTDGTRPTSGNKFAIVSDGFSTEDAEKIRVGPQGSVTVDIVFDTFRVDDAEIGSNPE